MDKIENIKNIELGTYKFPELRPTIPSNKNRLKIIYNNGNVNTLSFDELPEKILLDDIELGWTGIKLNEVKQFNYDGHDHPPFVKGKSTFGVNCEMTLKFSVPTYMWLLENI